MSNGSDFRNGLLFSVACVVFVVLMAFVGGATQPASEDPDLTHAKIILDSALKRGDTVEILIACEEIYRHGGGTPDGCPARNSLDG